MFRPEHFESLVADAGETFDKWLIKFKADHLKIQQLDDEFSIQRYDYHGQSMQRELYKEFVEDHMTDGVMDFFEFRIFLEMFDLFDKVEQIDRLYTKMKTENYGCKSCLNSNLMQKAREYSSDESSRLKRILDPNYQSTKTIASIAYSLYTTASKLSAGILQNVKLFSKFFLIATVYQASLSKSEPDYKFALILLIFAVTSTFLVTYSAIMRFKYKSGQFEMISNPSCYDYFILIWRYVMLTAFGVLMSVIPMLFLDICRMLAILLTQVLFFWQKDAKNSVEEFFDRITANLVGMDIVQVKNLKFTAKIVKLTYEDVIWTLV
jgi:hypothetical protein